MNPNNLDTILLTLGKVLDCLRLLEVNMRMMIMKMKSLRMGMSYGIVHGWGNCGDCLLVACLMSFRVRNQEMHLSLLN